MKRESFILSKKYWEIISELDDRRRLEVYDAIVKYTCFGIEPVESKDGMVNLVINFIMIAIDEQKQEEE